MRGRHFVFLYGIEKGRDDVVQPQFFTVRQQK